MRRQDRELQRFAKLLTKLAFEKTAREKKELYRLWSRLHPADRIYTLPEDFAERALNDHTSDRSGNEPD